MQAGMIVYCLNGSTLFFLSRGSLGRGQNQTLKLYAESMHEHNIEDETNQQELNYTII